VLERPTVGVAAGLFHATTGYSLPMAVELADALGQQPTLEAGGLTAWLQAQVNAHWARGEFFRLLNRMLFRGAAPDDRVKIFESFYRHDEAVIGRFYAGRLTALDKLRVLARGAPTVPGPRAIRAALRRG
jgi:lycopene beta-cyclase